MILIFYCRRDCLIEPREEGDETAREGKTWLSLYRELEALHSQAERSRDILQLAGDSVRVEASLATLSTTQNITARFPKSQACQTEQPEEASHSDPVLCRAEACFCSAGEEPRRSWGRLTACSLAYIILILTLFTFGCGLELDRDIYYPATWHLLGSVHHYQ